MSQPQLDDLDDIKIIMQKVSTVNPDIGVRITTKGGFVNNTDSIDFSSVIEADQWNKIKNPMTLF